MEVDLTDVASDFIATSDGEEFLPEGGMGSGDFLLEFDTECRYGLSRCLWDADEGGAVDRWMLIEDAFARNRKEGLLFVTPWNAMRRITLRLSMM